MKNKYLGSAIFLTNYQLCSLLRTKGYRKTSALNWVKMVPPPNMFINLPDNVQVKIQHIAHDHELDEPGFCELLWMALIKMDPVVAIECEDCVLVPPGVFGQVLLNVWDRLERSDKREQEN